MKPSDAAALLPRFLDTQIDSLIGKQPKKTRENLPTEKIKRKLYVISPQLLPAACAPRVSILGIISIHREMPCDRRRRKAGLVGKGEVKSRCSSRRGTQHSDDEVPKKERRKARRNGSIPAKFEKRNAEKMVKIW